MAVGKVTVLDIALRKIGAGIIDLDSDSFKVALLGDAQAVAADFAGASTDARFADLTAEVAGAGYTAGGAALANVTWTRAGPVVTLSADPTTWSGLDATVKYAAIYKTAGNADLLAFFDIDNALPAGRVIAGSDFTINWTGGLFTLTRVD